MKHVSGEGKETGSGLQGQWEQTRGGAKLEEKVYAAGRRPIEKEWYEQKEPIVASPGTRLAGKNEKGNQTTAFRKTGKSLFRRGGRRRSDNCRRG